MKTRKCIDCDGTGEEQIPCDPGDTVCEFCNGTGRVEVPESWLKESELEAINHLPKETPYLIRWVTGSMFSVARFYGGATFNGAHYTYNPLTDELIRDDVLKLVMNLREPPKKKRKRASK